MSGVPGCCCGETSGSGGTEPPPPFEASIVNVGDGAEVYRIGTGPNPWELRSITSDDGSVVIVQDASTIDLSVPSVPNVTLSSAGGTESLVNDGTGPTLATKGLTAGTGIALTGAADSVTITNTAPASAVTLASIGTGESLVNDGTGPALVAKSIDEGAGISVSDDGTTLTIANTDPGSAVTLANAGVGETLIVDGVAPSMSLKGLVAGLGIAVTSNATDVTITGGATNADAGTGTVIKDGASAPIILKTFTAGAGILVGSTVDNVVITNSSPGSAVTLASTGLGQSIVNDGVGPALVTKGLAIGPVGIDIVDLGTSLRIDNTEPASSVTLSSAGGTTLVNDGTGPALAIKGLTAGTNVTITNNANDLVINASTPAIGGTEFVININGSDVAVSSRTVKTEQFSASTMAYVNIAAGSQTCKVRWKSVTNGNTSTVTARQLYAASNLGTTTQVSATGSITVTSSTLADMTTMTMSLIAGEWLVWFNCDMIPAP